MEAHQTEGKVEWLTKVGVDFAFDCNTQLAPPDHWEIPTWERLLVLVALIQKQTKIPAKIKISLPLFLTALAVCYPPKRNQYEPLPRRRSQPREAQTEDKYFRL